MSEMDLIAPQKTVSVAFGLEPAYNVLCSLCLLNSDLSGHSQWASRTAVDLSAEQLQVNEQVCDTVSASLEGKAWPSFPVWVDDLAGRDPFLMRDQKLDLLLRKAGDLLGPEAGDLPDREALLADRSLYVSLEERLCTCKECEFDRAYYEATHARFKDPVARWSKVVAHLRWMWEQHLADEWNRNLPMLRESVAAFESIDYTGKSVDEIFVQVTARQAVPDQWDWWQQEAESLIFIPSPHIGPYLMLINYTDRTARIVFGARVPEGATVRSPALSRSELLMRLGALSDETRLRILELVAGEGELCAREIISRLELSQSSASRHLRQLSATGYLIERRQEGAKCYRLNRERIDDSFGALRELLQ